MKHIAAFGILTMLGAPLAATAQTESLRLIPQPQTIQRLPCSNALDLTRPLRVARAFDPAALQEINDRWHALGLRGLTHSGGSPDIIVRRAPLAPQAYVLVAVKRRNVASGRAVIVAGSAAGAFYGAMTLAQLPQRVNAHWQLPCVAIHDEPALKWRILSDDVSRGPLPTMRYFKERIRTIAAFKMNGYSPYMEHFFLDPRNPLPAPLDGITPAQLRELAIYSKRFHVTFIPEQQTFAHMHNTL
ncbi:MAG: hypothetical protein JOZ97_04990, partial [Candidatus Eremiobacteraeota bacterium]|nr:hypothetical protein [Candidatus Eremiobacteraeota bacterium]